MLIYPFHFVSLRVLFERQKRSTGDFAGGSHWTTYSNIYKTYILPLSTRNYTAMQCDSYQREPWVRIRIRSTHAHTLTHTRTRDVAPPPVLMQPSARFRCIYGRQGGTTCSRRGVVAGQSPPYRGDTGSYTLGRMTLPRLLKTFFFFFRGHLRRLAAPKARQERSSSTRVTRCSPPYDRSVDRDDPRKKIATLSFKRERLSQR